VRGGTESGGDVTVEGREREGGKRGKRRDGEELVSGEGHEAGGPCGLEGRSKGGEIGREVVVAVR